MMIRLINFLLKADAYTDETWFDADLRAIVSKSWQWVCHVEKTREPGGYVTVEIAGNPIAIVRARDNVLRAFYNVCKHRAHELLSGEGSTTRIMCPYLAWVYKLHAQLTRAPHPENLEAFDVKEICLDQVQVEEFCGFCFCEPRPGCAAAGRAVWQSGDGGAPLAPDLDQLTFAHRLTCDIKSNRRNVVDNFLECYHCPTAQ